MTIEKVLITGAAGSIGAVLRSGLAGHYQLRLSDVAPLGAPGRGEEHDGAELSDLAQVEAAMAGMDAVVHLGAIATEADFDSLLGPNFIGAYNVFEAARRQGVRRVVYASSNHAVGFYPTDRRIGPDVAQRPDGFYGVGKAFGENLGCLYFHKWGIECACLRIGSFLVAPTETRHLSTWISHGDMVRLVRCCLDAPLVGFAVLYGVSANTRGWWDNPDAARLGYHPQDNAEDYAEDIPRAAPPADPKDPAVRFMGGFIAAIDYDRKKGMP
jgi:uronate dehydrogenase